MEGLDLSLLEKGGPMMWVLLLMSLVCFLIFILESLLLSIATLNRGIKHLKRILPDNYGS